MSQHIQRIQVDDVSLAPAQAELRITVTLVHDWGNAEIRGRLMGPRCRFSRTVEIAYPLRPLPDPGSNPRSRSFRVIIPEASWWDLQSPFLYEGPVELWQEGQRLDQAWVSHGLRSLSLGPRGLRLNGRTITLRLREVYSASEADLASWRTEGINLLIVLVSPTTEGMWSLADQFGVLVVGRLPDSSPETRERVTRLQEHACCLGWFLPQAEEGTWIGKGLIGEEVIALLLK